MRKLWVVFSMLLISLVLVACMDAPMPQRDQPLRSSVPSTPRSSFASCSVSEYKTQATAQMNRLQSVMQGIDLSNKSAIAQEKQEVSAILGSINSMSCRNAFPLKQETLEYSARHFLDVLKHAESGDLAAMQTAINRMELNVDTFYDWSVDMK